MEFLLGVTLDLGGLLRPDGLAIVEVIRWVILSQKSVPSSPKKESSKFSLSILSGQEPSGSGRFLALQILFSVVFHFQPFFEFIVLKDPNGS